MIPKEMIEAGAKAIEDLSRETDGIPYDYAEAYAEASLTAAFASCGCHPAFFTHQDSPGGHLYYFAPVNTAKPPYLQQRHVKAIVDIDSDGTLAGVELIDNMPPPPDMKE